MVYCTNGGGLCFKNKWEVADAMQTIPLQIFER